MKAIGSLILLLGLAVESDAAFNGHFGNSQSRFVPYAKPKGGVFQGKTPVIYQHDDGLESDEFEILSEDKEFILGLQYLRGVKETKKEKLKQILLEEILEGIQELEEFDDDVLTKVTNHASDFCGDSVKAAKRKQQQNQNKATKV